MPELSLRQLQARLEDLEEQHAKDIVELRDLRREGAPTAKIEAAAEQVAESREKVKSADEEIDDAKATLRKHGYIIDDDDEGTVAESGNKSEGASETGDGESPETPARKPPAQEPPKDKPAKPEPDAEPVGATHWYDREV